MTTGNPKLQFNVKEIARKAFFIKIFLDFKVLTNTLEYLQKYYISVQKI